jgi:hypothetical protein
MFHYKASILGYLQFWKAPNIGFGQATWSTKNDEIPAQEMCHRFALPEGSHLAKMFRGRKMLGMVIVYPRVSYLIHWELWCAITGIPLLLGGLEHDFYDFSYIGNNHPNWLLCFFRAIGLRENLNRKPWIFPRKICFFLYFFPLTNPLNQPKSKCGEKHQ